MNTALAYETRTESAHHARADRFAELDELSFAELLSLEDDLSEGSQWSLLDDVRSELERRRDDADEALRTLFVEQCKVGGMLPMVVPAGALSVRSQLGTWTASGYLTESFGDAKWGAMVADVLIGLVDRERLLRAMAEEYATEQAESLLKAGWSAEQ